MDPRLIIEIPGQPIGKGRPRFTKSGITFTPEKTRNWEAWAKLCAKEALSKIPNNPGFSNKSLRMIVHAFFQMPLSWPAWKRAAAMRGEIGMTTRPDADNILKAVSDACQGIVYNDDSFITEKTIMKRWSEDNPRTIIEIFIQNTSPSQIAKK